jgi:hypothetical protein
VGGFTCVGGGIEAFDALGSGAPKLHLHMQANLSAVAVEEAIWSFSSPQRITAQSLVPDVLRKRLVGAFAH